MLRRLGEGVLPTQRSEGASLATPGSNPARTEPCIAGSASLILNVHPTLERPIVGVFDQAVADRVVSNI